MVGWFDAAFRCRGREERLAKGGSRTATGPVVTIDKQTPSYFFLIDLWSVFWTDIKPAFVTSKCALDILLITSNGFCELTARKYHA